MAMTMRRGQAEARTMAERRKTRHTTARRSFEAIANDAGDIRANFDISGGYHTGYGPPEFQRFLDDRAKAQRRTFRAVPNGVKRIAHLPLARIVSRGVPKDVERGLNACRKKDGNEGYSLILAKLWGLAYELLCKAAT